MMLDVQVILQKYDFLSPLLLVAENFLKGQLSDFSKPAKGFQVEVFFFAQHQQSVFFVGKSLPVKFSNIFKAELFDVFIDIFADVMVQPEFFSFLALLRF